MNLFIDTSFSKVHLALTNNDEVLRSIEDTSDHTLSDRLFGLIEDLFKGYDKTALTKIYVANGPGSFTGVRIGVTIAKTISWGYNIPLIPVSSLEVLASTIKDEDYIKVHMDARRGYVFAGVYNSNLDQLIDDKHMLLKDHIKESYAGNGIYASYDVLEPKINVVTPRVDYMKVINKHKEDKGINPHELDANYLKLTEAEENLNKKNDK